MNVPEYCPACFRLAVIAAIAAAALFGAPAGRSDDKPDLGKLIRQLGSDEFDEREKAQQSLEALGENDLPALRAAAKKSTDAEVQRRLAEVVTAIETRFTKNPYAFIEKVGGSVVTVDEAMPVKARPANTVDLSVILIDAKFGDADLHRLKELGKVACVTLTGTKVTDRGLPVLQSLPDLRYLSLDRTAVTDAGLAYLKPLKNLQELSLRDVKVKGKGLDHLKDLKGLWLLVLDGCDVTDDNLAHVVVLTRLTHLSLDRTKVSDAGLARLPALPELNYLCLEKTGVTDAGLAHLAGVKKLGGVALDGTCVTAEGIAGLQKTHPKLNILGKGTFDK